MTRLPNPRPRRALTTAEAIEWLKSNTITTESGCMEWQGSRSKGGYGSVTFNGRAQGAHRVMYELSFGTMSDGMHTDHLCRNPPCCNPEHLEQVTPKENVRRGVVLRFRDDKCYACGSLNVSETVDLFACTDCGARRDRVAMAKKMRAAKEQRLRREQRKTMTSAEIREFWKKKRWREKCWAALQHLRMKPDLPAEAGRTRA